MIYFSGLGTLTRDPELRYVGDGNPLCKFSLAVNERVKGGEKASFFDCEIWGRMAEVIAEHKKKGEKILVNGSLRQDTWETDGQKRSKVILRVSDVQFLSEGKKNEGASPTPTKPSKPNHDDSNVPF